MTELSPFNGLVVNGARRCVGSVNEVEGQGIGAELPLGTENPIIRAKSDKAEKRESEGNDLRSEMIARSFHAISIHKSNHILTFLSIIVKHIVSI